MVNGLPGGSMVKNLPANADSIPDPGRSPGEGNSSPVQHSCLENPMDRGAWHAAVCGVATTTIMINTHTILFLSYPCKAATFLSVLGRLTKQLLQPLGVLQVTHLDQSFHFTTKYMQKCALQNTRACVFHLPYHPMPADTIRRHNGPLKQGLLRELGRKWPSKWLIP